MANNADPAAAIMQNAMGIAQAFAKHFYSLFENDRGKLFTLYQNNSALTFEGNLLHGAQAIGAKYATLGFKKVRCRVVSLDCQLSPSSGILLFVCGELKVDDTENPIKFSQVFHLLPSDPQAKNFYIHNDMFRLNYG